MRSWFWTSRLKAEQIAPSNVVVDGCKRGIKRDLIFELTVFASHHFRDALPDVLLKHPDPSRERNQEIGFLIIRRVGSQTFDKLRPQRRERETAHQRVAHRQLLKYVSKVRHTAAVVAALANQQQNTAGGFWPRIHKISGGPGPHQTPP